MEVYLTKVKECLIKNNSIYPLNTFLNYMQTLDIKNDYDLFLKVIENINNYNDDGMDGEFYTEYMELSDNNKNILKNNSHLFPVLIDNINENKNGIIQQINSDKNEYLYPELTQPKHFKINNIHILHLLIEIHGFEFIQNYCAFFSRKFNENEFELYSAYIDIGFQEMVIAVYMENSNFLLNYLKNDESLVIVKQLMIIFNKKIDISVFQFVGNERFFILDKKYVFDKNNYFDLYVFCKYCKKLSSKKMFLKRLRLLSIETFGTENIVNPLYRFFSDTTILENYKYISHHTSNELSEAEFVKSIVFIDEELENIINIHKHNVNVDTFCELVTLPKWKKEYNKILKIDFLSTRLDNISMLNYDDFMSYMEDYYQRSCSY